MTAIAVAFISAVSCDNEQPIENVTPEFPELVENYAVQAGDTLALTFTPNMDWEVTVPEDTMDFFWLIDESFQYSKISGKASEEPVTILVGVSDKPDFTNHTTTVKLTMNGETRIIAKYMLPAQEYSLQMLACQLDEQGAFLFDENGEYMFGTEEPENLALTWTGSDFRIRVRVTSNYDWTLTLPEWANADIPEQKLGVNDFNIYGVPSKYPLEETTEKIVFKTGDKEMVSFDLTIPGCSDIMSYGVEIVSSVNFDDAGNYLTPLRFMEGPVNAWISGVKDVTVFAVEKKGDVYDVSGAEPKWLDIAIGEYDSSSSAEVLQNRTVQISALDYSADSEALIFFMPPAGWGKVADLFTEDATAVKEEWSTHAVPVTFKKYGYITMADAAAYAEAGHQWEESSDEALIKLFGAKNAAQHAYVMTYKDPYGSDNGRLLFKETYSSVKVYDSALTEVEAGDEAFFLSFTPDEENVAGVIKMSGEVKNNGYVVFRDSKDMILAIVHCSFEPAAESDEKNMTEDIIADASRYFADPEAAAAAGATMIQYVMGPTRYECEEARNEGAILVKMTCPVKTHVELNIPASTHMVTAYPKDSYTLGGESLSSGGVFPGSSTLDVYFEEFPATFKGIPSIKFHNSSDKVLLVVYIEVAQ